MTIIIFILVLAVLIFVHELGHFLVAKANSIRVDAFAIGFGPKIFSFKRGETVYSLNVIPFGGYVKIFGENPDEESTTGPDAKRSFVNKSRWQQALVLIAGVTFNFVFAWLIYIMIFTFGVTATTDGFEKYADNFSNHRIMITDVLPESPAGKAGIKVGDVITSVISAAIPEPPPITDTQTIAQSIESIQNTINGSGGQPLTLQYLRGDEAVPQSAEIVPVQGLVENKYAVGIAMQNVADLKLPFFTAIYEGFQYTGIMMKLTAVGLYTFFSNIFQGAANFADVAGPVGIAGIVGNAAELGFTYLLMITALISINLGIINLIPFPALDGGRLLFVMVESVIRRRISPYFLNVVNAVGFVLLIILMVIVTFQDITKLIN